MYLYLIEIGFSYHYVEDKTERQKTGNREFNVVGEDVENAISKTKNYLWKVIDGIEHAEEVIFTNIHIYKAEILNYVDIV